MNLQYYISLATIEQKPCSPIMCPALEAPANGDVRVSGFNVGDTAVYTCDVNYQLDGRSTRTCGSDGQWTGEAPTCERKLLHQHSLYNKLNRNNYKITAPAPIMCPAVEAPANGDVRVFGFNVGNVAIYTCNVNYQLDGRSTRTCGSDGQWSAEAPTCTREE